MNKGALQVIFSISVITVAMIVSSQNVRAVRSECSEVNVVFARGSGQDLDEDAFTVFRDNLKKRLPIDDDSFYELGSVGRDGYRYPAVDITDWRNGNVIGAVVSAGMANDYGKSVDEGVNELVAYLNDLRNNKGCHDTKIVLGGYSQGAQVMGQSLDRLSPEIRSQIAFVALFGDPKLHLPEGGVRLDWPFTPPQACQDGRIASPWRRNIDNCWIYQGALGPRMPYLPNDMQQKVGLWCVTGDHVCGSLENINIPHNHGAYTVADGPIDQAVLEIVGRLAREGFDIDTILDLEDTTPGLSPDVMFLVDSRTLESRSEFLASQQPVINMVGERIDELDGSIYLGSYGQTCDGFSTIQVLGSWRFMSFYEQFTPIVHCPSPVAEHTLDSRIQAGLEWFPDNGSKKVFVIITDEPYVQLATSMSYHSVGQTQQVQDKFSIYPIVPDSVMSSYENLHVDGGETLVFDKNNPSELLQRFQQDTVRQQAQPHFDSPDYKAVLGQAITFSAESSLTYNDEIVEYQWNFDGGATDAVTTEPVVSYMYTSRYEGPAELTILTKSGREYTATTNVMVQEESVFLPALKAPKNLRVSSTESTNARLTWAQNQQADRWMVTLDGIPLGYTDKTTILVTDVQRQHDVRFAVYGVTAEGDIGERAEETLSAASQTSTDLESDSSGNVSVRHDTSASSIMLDLKNSIDVPPFGWPSGSFLPVTNSIAVAGILGSANTPTNRTTLDNDNFQSSILWILFVIGFGGVGGMAGWLIHRRRRARAVRR